MLSLLALLFGSAHAAGLDQLEVGGAYGTPAATDATALWWNPAGLGAGTGTRIHLEGAPTLASVRYDRTDPHGYGGLTRYESGGVVPFAGFATDLGVKDLGIGAALAVPMIRGATMVDEMVTLDRFREDGEVPPPGSSSGRYHVREGQQLKMFFLLGGAYEIEDRVSLGVAGALVDSTWRARTDSETLTALHHAIQEDGAESGYTDAMIEDPRYGTTLDFGPLKDIAFTFNAGVRVVAVPERVVVSASYNHGFRVDNRGDLTMRFSCPPSSDSVGRFGAERLGLCYGQVAAHATVGYDLPSRVVGSVQVQPVDGLWLEALGGWVGWSAYEDFEITIRDVAELNEDLPADTAGRLEQERLRARAAHDSAFFGLDVKGTVAEDFTFGGRAVYDLAAIPDEAMSPNNQDYDTLKLGAMAAWRPTRQLEFGASYTHDFLQTRTITDSKFGVSLDAPPAQLRTDQQDRYFYPHTNGTYGGSISRVGLFVRVHLGNHEPGEPELSAPERDDAPIGRVDAPAEAVEAVEPAEPVEASEGEPAAETAPPEAPDAAPETPDAEPETPEAPAAEPESEELEIEDLDLPE